MDAHQGEMPAPLDLRTSRGRNGCDSHPNGDSPTNAKVECDNGHGTNGACSPMVASPSHNKEAPGPFSRGMLSIPKSPGDGSKAIKISASKLPLRKRPINSDHCDAKRIFQPAASDLETPVGACRLVPSVYHEFHAIPELRLGLLTVPGALIRSPAEEKDRLLHEVAMATHQDQDGDTALHIAVVQGMETVVQRLINILVKVGNDLNMYNNLRQTPLHLAVITDQTPLVQILLQNGADPTLLDRHGQTAAHLCCEHGLSDCLKLVLSHPGAQECLKVRNYEGMTPLHLAVQNGNKELVRLLLDSGADIDALDIKSGRSPLIHAVENNNVEMVALLIERGSDVNKTSYSGNTALHSACGRGQVEVVRVLLRNGADSSLKNYHNDTAQMVAKNKKVTDVLRGKGPRSQNTKMDSANHSSSSYGDPSQSPHLSQEETPAPSPTFCPSSPGTPAYVTAVPHNSPHSPKTVPVYSCVTQSAELLSDRNCVAVVNSKEPKPHSDTCATTQMTPVQLLPFLSLDCKPYQPFIPDGGHDLPPHAFYGMQRTYYADLPFIVIPQSFHQHIIHGPSSHSPPNHLQVSIQSSSQSEASSMNVTCEERKDS